MVLYYESKHADLPKPHLIYVGKDKFENEDLIRWSWPEQDIWFHVDDLSSAHVYLRLNEGENIAPSREGFTRLRATREVQLDRG